ncbi:Acetyl-coenzyme A synthetase, cytoplasmic [Araneus ventricosus]|uniref:Acetyl-coenzyme A synthetase, cytoplasmic n=1 Tax=Araneus ventricosus TaxID=182803 RepID=A0A4Y2GG07_ARAVE|nr:Acetyl-coenzyme A synthetase, cytoplasmic [Araneus ventricosus]
MLDEENPVQGFLEGQRVKMDNYIRNDLNESHPRVITTLTPLPKRLVIKRPWPAIMRTIYGDQDRFKNTYFTKFPGYFCTGDGGMRDEDGFFWVTGRVDDMLNVSGHLLSTTEVENSLMSHKSVAEIAVVRHPHPVKGECLYCFVVLKDGYEFDKRIVRELTRKVPLLRNISDDEIISPIRSGVGRYVRAGS